LLSVVLLFCGPRRPDVLPRLNGSVARVAVFSCVGLLGAVVMSNTGSWLPVPGVLHLFGAMLMALAVCALAVAGDPSTVESETFAEGVAANLALLRSMAEAAELEENGTTAHLRSVALTAVELGTSLGLTDDDVAELYWAALLHDIGKTRIPAEVLQKPGTLLPEEFEQVKAHSSFGANAVLSVSSDFSGIANLVLAHHERWDGQGYPRGLLGPLIPLGARIIAVADAYEAMITDRPYRARLSQADALQVIRDEAGSHFDPDVAEAFCRRFASEPHGVTAGGAGVNRSTRFAAVVAERPSVLAASRFL
jgi:HD-GYP domain-containing protein (c-di-GMP phosphodiesterase class II)